MALETRAETTPAGPSKHLSLTEGALLGALAALIILSSGIPLLGFFTALAAPVPFVVVSVRHGVRASFLSLLVAFCLTAMLTGPVTAVYLVLVGGSEGLIIGLLNHARVRGARLVLLGTVATALSFAFSYYCIEQAFGLDEPIPRMFARMSERMEKMAPSLPFPDDESRRLFLRQVRSTELMFRIYFEVPIFFFLSGGCFYFLFDYHLCRWFCSRLGIELEPLPGFSSWRLPSWIGAACFVVLLSPPRLPPADRVPDEIPVSLSLMFNLFLAAMVVLWVFGLSFAYGGVRAWLAAHARSSKRSSGVAAAVFPALLAAMAMLLPLPFVFLGFFSSLSTPSGTSGDSLERRAGGG